MGVAVRAAGMTFRPMAVENLGGWTETAIREIKILKVLNHKNIVQLKEIVTSKGAAAPAKRGEVVRAGGRLGRVGVGRR